MNPAHRWIGTALAVLLITALPAGAQIFGHATATSPDDTDTLPPREEAAALEETGGYGYLVKSNGSGLALAINTAAHFCPLRGTVIVHPDHVEVALDQLRATALDDETWVIPDPEDGTEHVAEVQFAEAVFDDGSGTVTGAAETESLIVVPIGNVVTEALLWPRCWRIRLNHVCGNLGSCPAGCFFGHQYTTIRRHLLCRPQAGALCLEFLHPVCRITRFTCRDCTGPILWQANVNRWVCALP
jgi:hypothetical protein